MSTQMRALGAITCWPQTDCFRYCMERLLATPSSGGSTVTFGPAFDVVDYYGTRCSCSTYRVYNAAYTTANSVVGSSATFSQASLTGYPSSGQYKAQYIGTAGQGSCEITYLQASGPGILGVYYTATGFDLWWTIVVSIIIFIAIFCVIGIFFGTCCSCLGMRRTAGQTISYPGNGQTGSTPVSAFASRGHVYSTNPNGGNVFNQASIPLATAVPVTAADATSGVPVATEATPGIVRSSSQNDGRQVAIV